MRKEGRFIPKPGKTKRKQPFHPKQQILETDSIYLTKNKKVYNLAVTFIKKNLD